MSCRAYSGFMIGLAMLCYIFRGFRKRVMPLEETIRIKCASAYHAFQASNIEAARNTLIEIFKLKGEEINLENFEIKDDMLEILINPKTYKLTTLFNYPQILTLQENLLTNCWLSDAGQKLLHEFPRDILLKIATNDYRIISVLTRNPLLLNNYKPEELLALGYAALNNQTQSPKPLSP